MRQRNPVRILVVVVMLVCVAALLSSRIGRPRNAGMRTPRVNVPGTLPSRARPEEAAPSRGKASSPSVRPPGDDSPSIALAPTVTPPPRGETAPGQPKATVTSLDSNAGMDLNLETADLLDPAVLQQVLEKHKGVAELYRQLPDSRRDDLITALWSEQKLRDEIATLLPMAETSKRRALMLSQVHPRGPQEPARTGAANPVEPDKELMDLLNAPVTTPIDREEMIARLNLSFEIRPSYGLQWARKAKTEFPGDFGVSLKAQGQVLKAGTDGGDATPQELAEAEAYLLKAPEQSEWNDLTPWDRIESYYGIFQASDPQRAKSFYERELAREQNPEARRVLESLLALLEKK